MIVWLQLYINGLNCILMASIVYQGLIYKIDNNKGQLMKSLDGRSMIFLCQLMLISTLIFETASISPMVQSSALKAMARQFIQIQSPSDMSALTQISMLKTSNSQTYCQFKKNKIVDKIKQYYQLESYQTDITNNNWQTQIISTAYNINTQLLYALLSNGTLLLLDIQPNDQIKMNILAMHVRSTYQSSNVKEQVSWFDFQIYAAGNSIYGFRNQLVYKLQLKGESMQWDLKQADHLSGVKQIREYNNKLYVLERQRVLVIDNGKQFAIDMNSSKDLVSMDIVSNTIYLLDLKLGIIMINISTDSQGNRLIIRRYYQIEWPNHAIKLRVFAFTFLVAYRRQYRYFLKEYYLADDLAMKPIRAYQFQNIQDVIMFEDYALVNSNFQYRIIQHSIHSLPKLKQIELQMVYTSTAYQRIMEIIPLSTKKLDIIIVLRQYIHAISIANQQSANSLFRNTLLCTSQLSGISLIQVGYKGVCGSLKQSHQCAQNITYELTFTPNQKNDLLNSFDVVFITFWLIILIVIFVTMFYCKHKLQKQAKHAAQVQEKLRKEKEDSKIELKEDFKEQMAMDIQMKSSDK